MNPILILEFLKHFQQSKNYKRQEIELDCRAEKLSLYSEIPYVKINCAKAIEAIADLINLSILLPYCSGIVESEARADYVNLSLQYKEEGEWKLVKQLASHKNFHLNFLLEKVLEEHSTEYLFGSLLPLCIKRIKQIRVKFRQFDSELKLHVEIPQRKRGYNDKGSLPTDQEILWQQTIRDQIPENVQNPVKEDKILFVSPRRWKRS